MPVKCCISKALDAPEIVQLSYGVEQANSYLVVSCGHAVVIDACSSAVAEELTQRSLIPDFVFLTHEHADHLWGLNELRTRFPEVRVIAQEACSSSIGDPKKNIAAQYWIYAIIRYGEGYANAEAKNRQYRCAPAEIEFRDQYRFMWRDCEIKIIHTPGHSPGSSMTFVQNQAVFSGDTMLNEEVFLRFDGASCMM